MDNEFDSIDSKINSEPNYAAQADLERRISKEQNSRKEERFLWVFSFRCFFLYYGQQLGFYMYISFRNNSLSFIG